jgi:putative phage-type endonuclease
MVHFFSFARKFFMVYTFNHGDAMKIIPIQQGSEDWHKFRSQGIGASEAACLLGKNSWKSLEKLYMEKIIGTVDFDNEHMRRGVELEPYARAAMEKILGYELKPLCAVHDEHDFVRASFDGVNIEHGAIIEIKCPGEKDHTEARAGRVPAKYQPQCQWQMMVSGLREMTYVSFDGTEVISVTVAANVEMQSELLEKAKEFWVNVQNKVIPQTEEVEDEGTLELVNMDLSLSDQIKELEASQEEIRNELKKVLNKKNKLKCGEAVFGWTSKKGAVDYGSIPELKSVNLEAYRKPPTRSFYVKRK